MSDKELSGKELKEEVLSSWRKKIAWAEKQSQWGRVSSSLMFDAIGLGWGGGSCAFCGRYHTGYSCDGCPVKRATDMDGCQDTGWHDLDSSANWGEWLIYARKFYIFLENLKV